MAIKPLYFKDGITIKPNASVSLSVQGQIHFDSVSDRLKVRNSASTDALVQEANTATLTNKALSDSTTTIVDVSDATKKIKFDAAGTTGTTTTITGSQTTNRTLTLPDATDTLVGKATTDTLTNKTLSGNTATNLISGSGTLTLNTTGTVTVPNATDTLVGKATTDTLTNKTLSGNTATNLISGSGTLTLNTTGTVTVPNATDTLVGKATTDTLTNKTLTGNTAVNLISGSGTIVHNTSGTITVPNGTDTLVGKATTDTLTNKTLTAPVISTITNTGTLTLPTSTDTLVGRATTDTLTNKTLSGNTATNLISGSGTLTLNTSGTITVPNGTDTLVGKTTTDTLTNKTLTAPVISTITNTGTITLPTSTDTLVGRATTDTLTNKTLTSPTVNTPTIDVVLWDDQASSPSTPSSGIYKTYFKTNGKLYKLNSSGTETEIGAGVGGINYILNSDAEGDTTGWAAYADTAKNIPADGTGGSPSSTWTRTTSSPMRGTASFLWTKAGGANRQGEGVSYDFTIDAADKAKMLSVSFDYIVASGTFTASDGITAPLNDNTTTTTAGNSDLEVFIYDITNSRLIVPTPQVLVSSSATTPASFKGTFQTSSDSTSYRLIIHTAKTTTNNFTVNFDNVVVGPQSLVTGVPASDWKNDLTFTPSAGFGTVTNKSIWYRRVGDTLEVNGYWANGTVAGSTASIALPSGIVIDSAKLPSTSLATQLGIAYNAGGSSANITTGGNYLAIFYDGSDTANVYATTITTAPAFAKANGNGVAQTSAGFPFTFRIPVAGWSSNVQMSNDTDTRIVAARYRLSGDKTTTGILDYATKVYDTHSAVTTGASWKFTAPISGYYRVSVTSLVSSAVVDNFAIFKNGSVEVIISDLNAAATRGGSQTVLLNAGDYIDFRVNGATSTTFNSTSSSIFNQVSIERLSGPATIAASDTVAARYYNATASITGTASNITYSTKDYDTHNAYSGATYTVPISGRYQVNASILALGTFALNQTLNIGVYKNGTQLNEMDFRAGGANNAGQAIVSDIIKCVAGDLITFKVDCAATSPTVGSSDFRNYFSIAKIGN